MLTLARLSVLLFAVVVEMSLGFVTPPAPRRTSCTFQRSMVHQITQPHCRDKVALCMADEDESLSTKDDSSERETAEESVAVVEEEEDAPYPVDAPSPLLLASSMVLAISSVGTYK
jgi:hypothetical protein